MASIEEVFVGVDNDDMGRGNTGKGVDEESDPIVEIDNCTARVLESVKATAAAADDDDDDDDDDDCCR
jgi:hypothetical protein